MYATDLFRAKLSTMLECDAAESARKLAAMWMHKCNTRGTVSSRVMKCCWHGTDSTDKQSQLNALPTCASKAHAVRCMHNGSSRTAMCIDMCIDMCMNMCIDMCIDMCIHGC